MLLKWLPWKYMVRRVARHHGFLDPILVLSRLGSFAQPSEVGEPIELLRAGIVFHARGLMNTRAIQNNLDWIWPYWVERQFNPHDVSFIPRAFSISHVNLSHRNWTAVGVPDAPFLPIVDPSGLVTPFFDGWSLDAWLVHPGRPGDSASGDSVGQGPRRDLIPSKAKAIAQTWELEPDSLAVETSVGGPGARIESRVEVLPEGPAGVCLVRFTARADHPVHLVVSLRPYNPEGVSFIHEIRMAPDRRSWSVDGVPAAVLSEPAEAHHTSAYQDGDVYRKLALTGAGEEMSTRCKVGLATAAALYAVPAGGAREISLRIDLDRDKESRAQFPRRRPPAAWRESLSGTARLRTPEARWDFLYDAAVRSLLLHSPGEVFPGPYTYKRFWFRDAAFLLDAMIAAGLEARAERTLDLFPGKQTLGGYFLSQEGEWDSNGEALWILERWCRASGRGPKEGWLQAIARGGEWIVRKRMTRPPKDAGRLVTGLLPAGFSAEHLGPNDYYYWDDFWGVAGLESAANLLESAARPAKHAKHAMHDKAAAERFRRVAAEFRAAIDASIAGAQRSKGTGMAVPASPLRRMDSGAIGNVAASYPLALWSPDDPRMAATAGFLLDRCLYKGAFFQDMIHSGINAYLTLQLAQVLLRAGDMRCHQLIRDTAAVASPTGQWPEAIHPHTLGGCMGDGHHVWASAEWVLMMRNLFLREEGRTLILASGIPREWLRSEGGISFGPGPTRFGRVTVRVIPAADGARVEWEGRWHDAPEAIEIRLPGSAPLKVGPDASGSVLIPTGQLEASSPVH